jgi:hypothetical protein
MVSRRGIRFDGNNASVDSYDGDRGPYEYDQFTAGLKEIAEDYVANGGNGDGVVNRFANATVASASVGVTLGNADVWGYVATSGSSPNVGPNGYINDMVYPLPTPKVNPERVSLDFQANFPIVDIPPDGTGTVYSAFPGAVANEVVIGVPGSPTPEIYKISGSYSFSGTTKFRVVGPVRIIISGNFIAQTANNELIIDNGPIDPTDPTGPKNFDNVFANATMTRLVDDNIPPFQIWVGGNLDLGSGGIVNPSTTPASFQIYGTAPIPTGTSGTQTITLSGGSSGAFWAAAVYAPNADITINGSKEVFGAFVANSIRVMGDSHFHYDESMAKKGTGKYAIELWRELLTPAQRTAYTW